MRKVSNFFLKGCHHQFQFCGNPARFRGLGHHITASCLSTVANSCMEPMYIHCLPGYVSTLFLVEYPDQPAFLLLDCGSPSDVHRVRYYMERALVSFPPLKMEKHLRLATISHSHIDHSGGAGQFYEEGIPVAWPSSMEGTYDGLCGRVHQLVESIVISHLGWLMGRKVVENPFLSSVGFFGPYWTFPPPLFISSCPSSPSSSSCISRSETHRENSLHQNWLGQSGSPKAENRCSAFVGGGMLKDMDRLPAGFLDWWVIQLPGHVPHMVGFYHFFSRTFYVADLFVQLKGNFFPPFRIDLPDAYRKTLLRVRSLDVRCALLPHGGIINLTSASTASDGTCEDDGKVRGRNECASANGANARKENMEPEYISWKSIIDQVLKNLDQIQTQKDRRQLTKRISKGKWLGNFVHLIDHAVCVKKLRQPNPPIFEKLLTSSFCSESSRNVPPPILFFNRKTRIESYESKIKHTYT